MKNFELPKDQWKPAWGALFGAIPVTWIFWEPWQQQAGALEWALTALAFFIFLLLYAVYVIYWSRREWLVYICFSMAALAVLFTAYRPSGVIFFIFIAAIGPFAVGGKTLHSIAIIIGACALLGLEWWWFWPPEPMPFVVGFLALVLGAGTTFAARQQIDYALAHRKAERERIARDLHDILGHTLSVIIVKAELAGRLIKPNAHRAEAEIHDIEQLARKALDEVREAISGYRGGNLQTEIEHSKTILHSAGLKLDLCCENVTLQAAQERALTLVLREAITNIIRHARATHCKITLKTDMHELQLVIADNGIGGTFEEGFGMRGIRERTTAIGGSVYWDSTSEDKSVQGTVLTVILPLENRQH